MLKSLLILLLTFSFGFSKDLNSIAMDEGNIVLEATGYGKTPDESKKDALQELIHVLKSKVESQLDIVKHVKNDEVSEDVTSKIKIDGNSYFEGLHYGDPELDKDFYSVRVVVTQSSLVKTVENLFTEINQPLESMSKKQKSAALEQIKIVRALLPYNEDKTKLQNVTNKKLSQRENLINRALNMCELMFKVELQNVSIEIQDNIYKANEVIYLSPGNYTYTIKSEGYFDEKGVFYADAGTIKTIEKKLIKKSSSKIEIYIKSDNKFDIEGDVASVLSNYSVGVTNNSLTSNALDYKFIQEESMTIGSTKFYNLALSVEAYKGKKLFITKKASLKKVAQTKLSAKAAALAKALTKALLKEIELSEFKNGENIDYDIYLK